MAVVFEYYLLDNINKGIMDTRKKWKFISIDKMISKFGWAVQELWDQKMFQLWWDFKLK